MVLCGPACGKGGWSLVGFRLVEGGHVSDLGDGISNATEFETRSSSTHRP